MEKNANKMREKQRIQTKEEKIRPRRNRSIETVGKEEKGHLRRNKDFLSAYANLNGVLFYYICFLIHCWNVFRMVPFTQSVSKIKSCQDKTVLTIRINTVVVILFHDWWRI